MSQIKYVHVIEYETGERLIRPGKGNRSGTNIVLPDDDTDDWERRDWERVDYWRLPEPMPKSEYKEWWNENKDDDVHPIPAVLEAMDEADELDGGDDHDRVGPIIETIYVEDPPTRIFGNVLIDGPDGQCTYMYPGIEERCPEDAVAHTFIDRGGERKRVEMCAGHAREDVPEPPTAEQEELVPDGSGNAVDGKERKVCLDLFAGLGGFSQAFEDAEDWEVVTVEWEAEFDPDLCADVLNLSPGDLLDAVGLDRDGIDVLVILASPPCTYFSTAGNHDHWNFDECRPVTDEAREAVTLVYHTLGLIHALDPDYWFLGEPTGRVTYCQYGRDYMKRTDLWGDHPPMTYRRCSRGSKCHTGNVEYDGTSATRLLGQTPAERAKVPYELSDAILEAIEDAHVSPPPEQTELVTDGGNDVERSGNDRFGPLRRCSECRHQYSSTSKVCPECGSYLTEYFGWTEDTEGSS